MFWENIAITHKGLTNLPLAIRSFFLFDWGGGGWAGGRGCVYWPSWNGSWGYESMDQFRYCWTLS